MTVRNHVDQVIEKVRREHATGEGRYVPMRIDFETLDGRILLSEGGRWDRRANEFDGDSDQRVTLRVHPGQVKAVEWFRAWIDAHKDRRENPPPPPADLDNFLLDTAPHHAYSAMFAGGRRGGKSWVGVGLACTYAVAFPNSIVWLVAPAATEEKLAELKRYVAGCLAAEWIERESAHGWELCNGSSIILKGAHGEAGAEALKEGEAHLIVLNEGQRMKQRAFIISRGAVVDKSGLVLVCANPPVEAKDEVWVSDFAADARLGKRASVLVHFNPLLNPFIDRTALLSMRAELDERTFQIEVLGMFLGPKDAVAYNWIRFENEATAPPLIVTRRMGSVTEELLRELGEGDGITHVVGLDVQRYPHIGGPVYEFFDSPHPDHTVAWITDEVVLEGGDELDWCALLGAKGYDPDTTLIVCDASGQYQHSRRRKPDDPPPDWKGKGSFDLIRGEGFRRIVPPSKYTKANPEIVDRVRAFTSLIASTAGVRRLYSDADRAPKTTKAIREWKTINGKPDRVKEPAHLGDAASYPIVRLFPRMLRSVKTGHVDPVVAKVDIPPAPGEAPPALRVMPPTSGPARGARRGSRFRY